MSSSATKTQGRRLFRWLYFCAGWVAVAIGGIGIVVPGLPTTVFFIVAAWCFSRSSPRFEQWVLNLPKVGRLVADHRAGLGMPRRAKVLAISMLTLFSGIGVWRTLDMPVIALSILAAAVFGAAWIAFKVPGRDAMHPVPGASANGGELAG